MVPNAKAGVFEKGGFNNKGLFRHLSDWMRWGAKNFIAHEAHENILALHPNFWCHAPN